MILKISLVYLRCEVITMLSKKYCSTDLHMELRVEQRHSDLLHRPQLAHPGEVTQGHHYREGPPPAQIKNKVTQGHHYREGPPPAQIKNKVTQGHHYREGPPPAQIKKQGHTRSSLSRGSPACSNKKQGHTRSSLSRGSPTCSNKKTRSHKVIIIERVPHLLK